MKLRLEDNSLRLRLSAEEVGAFAQTGRLATTLQLAPGPGGQLTYALQRTPNDSTAAAQGLRVAYTPGSVTILVPDQVAHQWTGGEEISLSGEMSVADGADLRILVEKDLGCRH